MSRARRWAADLAALTTGAGIAALAFVDGGFFADATAFATLVALGVLLVVVTFGRVTQSPGAGASIAVVALTAYAVWVLASSGWSDATARALSEYTRVLLYLAVLCIFVLLGGGVRRARVLVAGLALGAVAVAIAGAATWLQPETFALDPLSSRARLNWPTSYWNATGLLAGLAAIWSLHVACEGRTPLAVRALGAAGVPLAAAALVFTVSRGAVAATVLAGAVYLILARGPAVLSGLVAVSGPLVAALVVSNGVEGLDVPHPSAGALEVGDRATRQLLLCAAAAFVLRLGLGVLDRRFAARGAADARRSRLRAPTVRGRAVVAGTAIVVAAVVLIASGAASSGLDEFRSASSVPSGLTTAERVTRLQNNGRLAHWRVALEHGFEPSPWQGSGAGTYAALWAQHRPAEGSVLDAHSLYVEQLGELGIVGLLLVVAVLLAMLAGLARRAWTEGGAWAALFAAALAWAAHSAVDWDWEMPATTLWLFAAGGLALARPGQGPAIATRRRSLRRGVGRAAAVAAIALLAAVPLSVLRSQSAVFEAVDALRDGDCAAAVARARDAMDILPQRSEPGEVLAYCATRAGRHADALRAIDAAIERDPREWTAAYGRALVLAAGGRDPRSAARRALRLNPNSRLTRNAVELFATGGRRAWRQRALQAPLALPPSPVELRRQIGR